MAVIAFIGLITYLGFSHIYFLVWIIGVYQIAVPDESMWDLFHLFGSLPRINLWFEYIRFLYETKEDIDRFHLWSWEAFVIWILELWVKNVPISIMSILQIAVPDKRACRFISPLGPLLGWICGVYQIFVRDEII